MEIEFRPVDHSIGVLNMLCCPSVGSVVRSVSRALVPTRCVDLETVKGQVFLVLFFQLRPRTGATAKYSASKRADPVPKVHAGNQRLVDWSTTADHATPLLNCRPQRIIESNLKFVHLAEPLANFDKAQDPGPRVNSVRTQSNDTAGS